MKVNICYLDLEHRDGYLNVSPFATPDSLFNACDIRNLEDVCDDEAEEIVAINVLNYLAFGDVFTSLANWIKKLRKGGHLVITFNDAYEVSRQIFVGIIEAPQVNEILYGKQDRPYDIKRCAIPMHELKNWLLKQNTKLVVHRLDGCIVTLEVEKL